MNTYKRNRRRSRRRGLRRWLAGASRGQAIVLLAVIMVVLIGFTALAIDGGQLYFLRRDAQNAVDAAVLSAVYALCAEKTQAEVIADAQAAALDNGFDDAADDVSVTVTTPYDGDRDGAANDSDDNYYVQVIINASKPPKLIQLVYQGPLEVTVSGVGHCRPAQEFSEVGAVFAGATGCENSGVELSGSEFIVDGGIHANSYLKINGSGNPSYVYGGDVTYGGGFTDNGIIYEDPNDPGSPNPPEGGANDTPMPKIWDIADFRPGGDWADIANDNGQYVAISGNLNDISSYVTEVDGVDVMDPGIYYVDGNISLNASDLNGVDASGVTWVAEGEISFGANEATIFSAYSAAGLWPMPLAFSNAGSRSCTMNMTEGISVSASTIYFTGVMYAPNGWIDFSVSKGGTLDGALVGWLVKISASEFELHYNPDLFPPFPPSGSLVE